MIANGALPTRIVFVTAVAGLVLLSSIFSVPLSETPGMFTETVPLIVPASPPAVCTNAPWPFVSETKSVVPLPIRSETLRAAMTRTFVSSLASDRFVPRSFVCSIVKSPDSDWPNTVSCTPVPLTRTNRPDGRSSVSVWPATVIDSLTDRLTALIATPNVPERPIPAGSRPVKLTVPLSWPAKPPVSGFAGSLRGTSTSRPWAFVSTFGWVAPMLRLTPVAARTSRRCPSALVVCSSAKLPVTVGSAVRTTA